MKTQNNTKNINNSYVPCRNIHVMSSSHVETWEAELQKAVAKEAGCVKAC